MLSFRKWVRSHTIVVKNECEEVVLNKIAVDDDFPESVCLWVMLDYLENKYSKREISAFETIYFQEYIKYITSASKPL